jgi:hypothetical protein
VQAGPDDKHDVRAHPHIGLATVTYLFEGAMQHRDSLGVVQRIEPGAINWMTAGRGIVHSERTPDDLRGVARQVEGVAGVQGTVRKLQGDAGRTRTVESEAVSPAAGGDNGELLRQVAMSVVDMNKMLCKTSTDFASLSRKVDNIETQMNTSQSHAETLKMLHRDMFSSTKPKKTRS